MNGILLRIVAFQVLMFAALPSSLAANAAAAYPSMASLDQYINADKNAEVALARSAAPDSISKEATILVFTKRGYETEVKGTNGFTCLVERSWMAPFDHAEFWNPRVRGPICYNPPASRTVLPYTINRTALALAGLSNSQMLEKIKGASAQVVPEPGAMSYMMSKNGYLGDGVGHWHSHLMFHIPKTDGGSWGANLAGSPVVLDDGHLIVPERETIFMVPVDHWSDGSPAPHGH